MEEHALTVSRDRRLKRWSWAVIDLTVLGLSVFISAWLRYDFSLQAAFTVHIAKLALLTALLHVVLGGIIGPYAIGHLRGSFEEILDLTKTVVAWVIPVQLLTIVGPWDLGPRSLPLTVGTASLLAMFGARTVIRAARTRWDPSMSAKTRVLVFGAGEGGRQLVRALVRDPAAGLAPVGVLDDDKVKRRMRIDGVKVLGTSEDLQQVGVQMNADILAIAVPSASPELVRKLQSQAREVGLKTQILPHAHEMLGSIGGSDLRSLDLADFLGRRPIELDATTIADTISGRTVLVTGAGGSIGSELCRQISKFGPNRLVMLDRDESALHGAQLSVGGQGLFESDDVVLADIRDTARMIEVFARQRPDVVFHAAALKHLPLLERYPEEAWKTNVLGTLNVLQAAFDVSVSTFVNVSTDKAANPSCILGYSKRLTERLTADFAVKDDNTYVSVRFGNVLGSRGSVISAFTAQIERGGPVTVTHPDVERYFMLIPEACQLVLQAAAIGRDGEVMVLDMGEPAKIEEVARTLIDLSGRKDVEIVYTGLRPGEKMSEELFTPGEKIQSTDHTLVSSVGVPALTAERVLQTEHPNGAAAANWMREKSSLQPEHVQ